MAFDPTKPINGVLIDADFLRGQFNALNDKIDATPAGPPGQPGPPGSAANVTGAIVDSSDPAVAVIRTDIVDGAPKLVGFQNVFVGREVSTVSFSPVDLRRLVDGENTVPIGAFARCGFEHAVPLFECTIDLGPGNESDVTTLRLLTGLGTFIPAPCHFRWSDNGSDWTVVGSFSLSHGVDGWQEFAFASSGPHRFWGFVCTDNNTGGQGCAYPVAQIEGLAPASVPVLPLPEISRLIPRRSELIAETNKRVASVNGAAVDNSDPANPTIAIPKDARAQVGAPAASDDAAAGYAAGSRWYMSDGREYFCTDATPAAAVWQQVTPAQMGTLGFPAWDGGGNYSVGDAVSYAGTIYRCISPISGAAGDPTLLPASWTPISSMFEAVATVAQGAAADAMNGAFVGTPIKLPFGWNFVGFEAWDGGTAYNPGDALTYALALYVAIAAHTGVAPDSNPAIWTLIPTFFDLAGAATAKADAAQAAAIAASSNNTNAVATLDTPFADPDTEAVRLKLNEMLLAQRR